MVRRRIIKCFLAPKEIIPRRLIRGPDRLDGPNTRRIVQPEGSDAGGVPGAAGDGSDAGKATRRREWRLGFALGGF